MTWTKDKPITLDYEDIVHQYLLENTIETIKHQRRCELLFGNVNHFGNGPGNKDNLLSRGDKEQEPTIYICCR